MILERGVSVLSKGEKRYFKTKEYHMDVWTFYRKIVIEPVQRKQNDNRFSMSIFFERDVWPTMQEEITKMVATNRPLSEIKSYLTDNHVQCIRSKMFHNDMYEFWYSNGNDAAIRDTYSSTEERKIVEGRTW